jgi:hypothetical protein
MTLSATLTESIDLMIGRYSESETICTGFWFNDSRFEGMKGAGNETGESFRQFTTIILERFLFKFGKLSLFE